ncbi:hypothetical protein ES332_A02G057800v1 [Gossypium tomentosum]|uniref:Uncharacterized protein n=1 Tax=Gossypium tomentosum TaxID=34277 RepID=A0A5D2RH11_GOSTO|nr:hypothetical protein ES332_A02G057800v1 [Gossypium tomentosum]
MVKKDKEELSEEERKALRGSKFAPLPPPSLSKPRLAHPGGPLTTNKAAALAKFLERKLQDPNGFLSVKWTLNCLDVDLVLFVFVLVVFMGREAVGGASSSGTRVRHVDSFGDSEDSLEEAKSGIPEPKKDTNKNKNRNKKNKKKKNKMKKVVEDHECTLKRPKKKVKL